MPRIASRRLALLVALLLLAGCGGASDGASGTVGPTRSGSTTAASTTSGSDGGSPTPVVEGGGTTTAPVEERGAVETAAAGGDAGVSVELAGLPVGGGEAVAVDDSWCQVLFWGQGLPEGVTLQIDAVVPVDGAVVDRAACGGTRACVGATITADSPGGCSVLVTPPSPQAELVKVRLDGTLTCPDEETCAALAATSGPATAITRPTPPDPEPDGTDGGETGETEDSPTTDADPGTGTADASTAPQG